MSIIQIVRRIAGSFAVLSLAVHGLNPALAQDAVILSPSSPWNLDYAVDRCRLVRFIGEDENRTVLILEQLSPSDHFELILAGKAFNGTAAEKPVTLQMGPGYDAFERQILIGNLGDIEPALIFGSITPVHAQLETDQNAETGDRAAMERAFHPSPNLLAENGAKVEWIEFKQGKRTLRLNTGSLAKPLEALVTCTNDLVRDWGLDPNVVASVVVEPKVTNIEDVTRRIVRTYPLKALSRGEMATIELRLIIDERGEIADCKQLELTIADNFGDFACKAFRTLAKFEPAMDPAGKPVKSYTMQRVAYRIR